MPESDAWDESKGAALPLPPPPPRAPLPLHSLHGHIKACCCETIAAHAHFNPMMVCQSCKHLIKCFTAESSYRNYLTFCKSRGRQVVVDELGPYKVVVFKTYEPFR